MDWSGSNCPSIAALLLSLPLVGCGTSDKLVGRYATATCETIRLQVDVHDQRLPADFLVDSSSARPCGTVIPSASASAISIATPTTATAERTGADLPDRALAAYVAALARLTGDSAKLRAALAAPIAEAAARTSAVDDRTVFKRTLVVSTRLEGGFNPADRLEQTDILIRPYGAIFTEWDLLVTTQGTVDPGSVQLTRGRSTTQSLSAAAPSGSPVTVSGSLGATQTEMRVEQVNTKAVVSNLSAAVDEAGAFGSSAGAASVST